MNRRLHRFLDNLYSYRLQNRPTIKNKDIEEFFAHVGELKSRVEELERAIVIHAFENRGAALHPHNERLLEHCRIPRTEANAIWGEILRERDRAREQQFNSIMRIEK